MVIVSCYYVLLCEVFIYYVIICGYLKWGYNKVNIVVNCMVFVIDYFFKKKGIWGLWSGLVIYNIYRSLKEENYKFMVLNF